MIDLYFSVLFYSILFYYIKGIPILFCYHIVDYLFYVAYILFKMYFYLASCFNILAIYFLSLVKFKGYSDIVF